MEIKTQEIEIRHLRSNRGQIEGLPKNPRKISKKKLEQLKKSVQDAPEMLKLRELIAVEHDDGYIVICGNQRLEAAKALGMETLPVKVLPSDTPVEKLREYAIKDNLPFGEDDWEVLSTDWDVAELEEWGMDVPQEWEEPTFDFDPSVLKNLSQESIGDYLKNTTGLFEATLLFPDHIKEKYSHFVKDFGKQQLVDLCIIKIQESYA